MELEFTILSSSEVIKKIWYLSPTVLLPQHIWWSIWTDQLGFGVSSDADLIIAIKSHDWIDPFLAEEIIRSSSINLHIIQILYSLCIK